MCDAENCLKNVTELKEIVDTVFFLKVKNG